MGFKFNPLTSQLDISSSGGSGSGDVTGPATNTDLYIPQWNGTNSKALANGIPTSTFAAALGADDNYVTDAEKVVIGNTSGTNTGDNATNTQYSGLATSKQDTLVSGTNIKTVNSNSLLGAGDVVISGGQTLYDHVVAASGGTHTTLGAAIAAASAGDTIFVRSGTYSESAITSALNNITIVGENPQTAVLEFTTNNLTLSGTNVTMMNLYASFTTGTMAINGADSSIRDCKLVKSSTGTFITMGANNIGIDRCYIEYAGATTAINLNGRSYAYVTNCYIYVSGATSTGGIESNSGYFQKINDNTYRYNGNSSAITTSESGTVSGNTIIGNNVSGSIAIKASGVNYASITGNAIYNTYTGIRSTARDMTITGNAIYFCNDYGIYIETGGQDTVTGNLITGKGSAGTGIYLNSVYNTVSANRIRAHAKGIDLISTSEYCNITDNALQGNTTNLTVSSTKNRVIGNTDTYVTQDVNMVLMKNTSGGSLSAGQIVVWKAVAAGDEVTTTTTASDTKVFGMAVETIANNASGYIQTLGKTTLLKADGTTDIAVGDFLTTFTTAGIVAKAAAGNTAIAIALEAYTTNDSNGVIDALIIQPRVI